MKSNVGLYDYEDALMRCTLFLFRFLSARWVR